jgi:hypothetical protein
VWRFDNIVQGCETINGYALEMRLRNNVTFKASMPFDVKRHPVGEEVASYLASAVEARTGLKASIEDWRDTGFELDFVLNGKPVHFAFAYFEDTPFHFYGQVASYVGWLRRLCGYRDQDEQESLIRALSETLRNDPTFSDVFWHEAWYDETQLATQP